ncbi:MAG TPA: hypothetical protein VNA11_13985, partial [Pseudonocardia sp.]|nr:hypothetical protein [Pseudonocardia sp.]
LLVDEPPAAVRRATAPPAAAVPAPDGAEPTPGSLPAGAVPLTEDDLLAEDELELLDLGEPAGPPVRPATATERRRASGEAVR